MVYMFCALRGRVLVKGVRTNHLNAYHWYTRLLPCLFHLLLVSWSSSASQPCHGTQLRDSWYSESTWEWTEAAVCGWRQLARDSEGSTKLLTPVSQAHPVRLGSPALYLLFWPSWNWISSLRYNVVSSHFKWNCLIWKEKSLNMAGKNK